MRNSNIERHPCSNFTCEGNSGWVVLERSILEVAVWLSQPTQPFQSSYPSASKCLHYERDFRSTLLEVSRLNLADRFYQTMLFDLWNVTIDKNPSPSSLGYPLIQHIIYESSVQSHSQMLTSQTELPPNFHSKQGLMTFLVSINDRHENCSWPSRFSNIFIL